MDFETNGRETLAHGTADPQFDQRFNNGEQYEITTSTDSLIDIIKQENPDVEDVSNRIGSGGQCVGVYKVRNIRGEWLALKIVKKDDNVKVENARKEISNLRKISSEGVIKLKKVIENENYIYIHMELMEGSMEAFVGSKTAEMIGFKKYCFEDRYSEVLVDQAGSKIGMRLDWISDWLTNLLEAISAIHEKGMVHNDVKLENILFKTEHEGDFSTLRCPGNLKVADLGCCEPDGGSVVTGTMRNFAPECFIVEELLKACQTQTQNKNLVNLANKISLKIDQIGQTTKSTGIQDYKGISTKVDIWALGLAVVYMAIGENLFTEKTRRSMVIGECLVPDKHNFRYTFNEAIRRMPEYLKSDILYDSFKEFLRKCLEHCPEDRPSAKELMKMDFITKKRKRRRIHETNNVDIFGDKRNRTSGPVDCPDEHE